MLKVQKKNKKNIYNTFLISKEFRDRLHKICVDNQIQLSEFCRTAIELQMQKYENNAKVKQ